MSRPGAVRVARTGQFAQRTARPRQLGRAKIPVLAAFAALVGLALGVPIASSVYWMFERTGQPLQGASLLSSGLHTALYAACAGALATVGALPVALLAVRHGSRIGRMLERSTYLVLATPGVVIVFALSYFSLRYANGLGYQSAPMLVLAYTILFFPLALVGVGRRCGVSPVGLEEVARSLGLRRPAVLLKVTLPLIGPGLAAAFCLVFLAVVTELTATLILLPWALRPFPTNFWAYEQNLSYGQAAPFALVMILVAAGPSYALPGSSTGFLPGPPHPNSTPNRWGTCRGHERLLFNHAARQDRLEGAGATSPGGGEAPPPATSSPRTPAGANA